MACVSEHMLSHYCRRWLAASRGFLADCIYVSLLQDAAWREQQRRLLSAHFGPREVESLAMNAVLPLDRDEGCVAGAPLLWVQQREMKVCRISAQTGTCCPGRQSAWVACHPRT